jgi:amidase
MKFRLSLSLIILVLCMGCQKTKNTGSIDVSELTIAQIHQAYESGQYTSEQLVTAYLERIEQFDENINSITHLNPTARAIAKTLDEEYSRTKVLRPLHGIPIVVKDNIETKDLVTTVGSKALQNFIPAQNAFIVERLVEAGAIVIAKSNMAEWASTPWASISATNGETANPYNFDYTPAGSSGGTGASVAANFATLGLGTDTGNSVRGPSSHCALVGFRPTMGLVSRSGIVPLDLRNDMAGPMCRTVEDATRVLEIIAGVDPLDSITQYAKGNIPDNYVQFLDKDGLKGARIGVFRAINENDPDPEIKALFDKAIADLQALGAEVVDPLEIPDFDNLKKNQWCEGLKKFLEPYLASNVKIDSVKTLQDIIRIGTTVKFTEIQLADALKYSGRFENQDIACGDAYTDVKRIAFRKAIEDKMDELHLDALVYPSWNTKPIKVNTFIASYADDKGVNSLVISPHTGQPAFTVPMGFNKENLPVGLEFLGRMYAEPTLIRLVYAFEQGTRHRRPPVLNAKQ